MAQYVEFPLPDGGAVMLESDETKSGVVKAGRLADMAEHARETFEQAAENARKAALVILEHMRSLQQAPDAVEITFGLKASGELKTLVVAKAGAEASYSIRLTWKRGEGAQNGVGS
jgi:Trypsin-co-occurring domain 1